MLSAEYIAESKEQCLKLGLDPQAALRLETGDPAAFKRKFAEYRQVLSVIDAFAAKFLRLGPGMPVLVLTTDERGMILKLDGDVTMKEHIRQLGIAAGSRIGEEWNGTNSVSLALRHRQPCTVIGAEHYNRTLQNVACYSAPFRCHAAGAVCGTLSLLTFTEHANGLFASLLHTVVDAIERELTLQDHNRQLNILNKILADSAKTGIVIADCSGNVTEFNHYAEVLTGLKKSELLGKPLEVLDPFGKYIAEILENHVAREDVEVVIELPQHQKKLALLFDGMPIDDADHGLIGAYGQFRDISERYRTEERIQYLANHDDLTGLPNRRYFHDFLEREIQNAQAGHSQIALLLLDLDRFKRINDTLGHFIGDRLLMKVAARLEQCIGDQDKVFRMGGDEFIVVLTKLAHPKAACAVAAALGESLKAPFQVEQYEFDLTASIGIAYYPFNGRTVKDLLIHADTAMFQVKEQGRNSFLTFNPGMNRRYEEQLALEKYLRKAIVKNELLLHYQPQIELESGAIVGLEALIRWNHPVLGQLAPNEFIPLAEETGLIVSIGEWVLREACQQFRRWLDLGLLQEARVAVNLSSRQFVKCGLVNMVRKALQETGLDSRFLELEITESVTMDMARASNILGGLANLGVKIAIDDFGTGYSSLSYLKRFTLHCLKIDRSFIQDLRTDPGAMGIVNAILAMARSLGLKVIAEGVETEEQVQLLHEMNCPIVQGHYFYQPATAPAIEELLAERLNSVSKTRRKRRN
ncbi:PAS domain S-box-containing protein/diguanylate cyclase (GGDEF)-like protein [Hydrogenispora ethanolica]|uniref:PAS domain S-box-containing protein/diguanylate cyclase (GGDEF)-like protein n=1 Tax=Hydrogenispora ethanolica TaxID=1082276 RepID=A0A4R1RIS0_HYDET|nr:EAL domain-containing protein [Hydrogenispora ethanolica]TCL65889.1 PAS domain S-box-containing protein/diguanylate cyclase (GGDEF)-like protein [Hydrogenispora ethanolica]